MINMAAKLISLLLIVTLALSACDDWEGVVMSESSNTENVSAAVERGEYQKATFAAGCFWGIQERFRTTPGVVSTAAGYIGGRVDNPTYKQVCTDKTGHAEAVEIVYDPGKVSYEKLLDLFWDMHDPTQLNRQGPDFGSQYRSAIFYYNDEQKQMAEASKQKLVETKNIVTQINPAGTFYGAEEYHQFYLQKKGITSCGVDGGH